YEIANILLEQEKRLVEDMYQKELADVEKQIQVKNKEINKKDVFSEAYKYFMAADVRVKANKSKSNSEDGEDLNSQAKSLNFKDLSDLDKYYEEITRKMSDKKIMPNDTPEQKREKERILAVETAVQKIKEAHRKHLQQFGRSLDYVISKIERPKDVLGQEAARWELIIQNYDEETLRLRHGNGESSLNHFINTIDAQVAAIHSRWDFHIEQSARDFKWPHGYKNLAQVQDRIAYLKTIVKDGWAPADASPKMLKTLASMRSLEADLEQTSVQQKILQDQIKALRIEREKLIRFVMEQIPTEESVESQSAIVYDSENVYNAYQEFKKTLSVFKDTNIRYSEAQEAFQVKLKEESLKLATPALRDAYMKRGLEHSHKHFEKMAAHFLKAQNEFLMARANYRKARLNAALHGQTRTQKDPNGSKLKESLIKLLGSEQAFETGVLGANGVEFQLADKIQELDRLNIRHLKLKATYETTKAQYYQMLPPEHRIYQIQSYRWSALFNKPFNDLWTWFNDPDYGQARQEAFTTMMREWDGMWKESVLGEQNWGHFEWFDVKVGPHLEVH
nr:hypothetical protein [Pseudobdellovibrionaceae bacterium]